MEKEWRYQLDVIRDYKMPLRAQQLSLKKKQILTQFSFTIKYTKWANVQSEIDN